MEWTATDVIGVISYLLPGFLAAWVFYGLTAHPRKSPFERIVQALIFTVIIQGFTTLTRWAYEWGAQWHSFGAWTKDIALVASLVNATILGLLFAWFANKDWFHAGLRWLGVTKRTSYPSEWFSAFNRRRRYVILHLDGNRRLYGWPYEWPDQGDSGHFVIAQPSWILDDNTCAPLHTVEHLVIPVTEVEMVELLKFDREITADETEIRAVEKQLVELQRNGETENGKQSPSTAAPSRATVSSNGRTGSDGQSTHKSAASESAPTAPTQKGKVGRRRRGKQT